MDNQEIIIILSIINIILTGLSPIILALAYFLKHIKKSKCCGSSIEMFTPRPSQDDNVAEIISNLDARPLSLDLNNPTPWQNTQIISPRNPRTSI